ncbi:hypothetical protein [Chromohalobacter sp. 48-RD10]|uniref:hypothetical protein n=1 Tax=Chromohalobacter sp. 48-RD10 TaxID=2994063 RepID=UPI0024691DCB|nr:hypothetical protein [Chromohalobacter sp. 48-RD10]
MQNTKNIEFVITGCGRSGTTYVSELLQKAGIKCGHESVFEVTGPAKSESQYRADSSWFCAPFLIDLPQNVKVLHVVRNPAKVVSSFHRIGLCADTMWIQFSKGKTPLEFMAKENYRLAKFKKHFRRYAYVKNHRKLLEKYTTCFKEKLEVGRLWQYWYQWNEMIEGQLSKMPNESLVVRLEDIDSRLDEVTTFFGIQGYVEPVKPANLKKGYRKRTISWVEPGEEVFRLADYYGYSEEEVRSQMK